eukprot:jgi/Astpho2/6507/fgenesh1_pg.00096_%23_34_t
MMRPETGQEYPLRLGSSILGRQHDSQFCSLRFPFMPQSASRKDPARLDVAQDGGVCSRCSMELFMANKDPGRPELLFKGHVDPTKDDLECVAIFDGHHWRLELLSATVHNAKSGRTGLCSVQPCHFGALCTRLGYGKRKSQVCAAEASQPTHRQVRSRRRRLCRLMKLCQSGQQEALLHRYMRARQSPVLIASPMSATPIPDIYSPCCRYAKQTGIGKANGTMQPGVKPHSAAQCIRSQSPSPAPQRMSEEFDMHLQRPTSRSSSEQQQSGRQPHRGTAGEAGAELQGAVQGGSERGGEQQQRPRRGQSQAQMGVLQEAAGAGSQHRQEHAILPPKQRVHFAFDQHAQEQRLMNQCPPKSLLQKGAAMPPKAARPEAQPAHVHQHQQQERPAEQARRGEQRQQRCVR